VQFPHATHFSRLIFIFRLADEAGSHDDLS
jgi:hypothetical protein